MYMGPAEQSQVFAILFSLEPKHCLEWGCGGSTQAILSRCDFVEHYVSIEHQAAWYKKVRDQVFDPRLTLRHVPPNKPMAPSRHSEADIIEWESTAEHDRSVFSDYIDYPTTLGLKFDFVLVDGRARRFCLRTGFDLLLEGGVIVLHDAQRAQYHDALSALGSVRFLEPFTQGQVALVKKLEARTL